MNKTVIQRANANSNKIPDPGRPIDWGTTEKLAEYTLRFMKIQKTLGKDLDLLDELFEEAFNVLGEDEDAAKVRAGYIKARNRGGYWFRKNLGSLIDQRVKQYPERMKEIMSRVTDKVSEENPQQLVLPF